MRYGTNDRSVSNRSERFFVLDLIRGIACLLVLWMHYAADTPYNLFPGSWMAVDLFFILSGFVVTHVIEIEQTKYSDGLAFMVLRIYRLYPAYAVGLLLGIAAYVLAHLHEQLPSVDGLHLGQDFLFGVFLIPDLHQASDLLPSLVLTDNSVFPLNAPSWTLFFELLVNVLFIPAYFGSNKTKRLYPIAIISSFVIYLGIVFLTKSGNNGWSDSTFGAGIVRVFAEFGIGYLAYKHRALYANRVHVNYGAILIVSSLLALGCIWASNPTLRVGNYLILPIIIVSGSCVRVKSTAAIRSARWLGALSYPIYIVHIPILSLLLPFSSFELVPRLLCVAISIAVATVIFKTEAALRRRRSETILAHS